MQKLVQNLAFSTVYNEEDISTSIFSWLTAAFLRQKVNVTPYLLCDQSRSQFLRLTEASLSCTFINYKRAQNSV